MSVVKVFLAVLNCALITLEAIAVIVRMGIKLVLITILVLVRYHHCIFIIDFACDGTDINECASHNGGCEQNCQNTIGSYSCSCLSGYLIDSNGYNCTGLKILWVLIIKILYSIYVQISMSVLHIMEVVVKVVLTLLVHTYVPVVLDII